MTLVTPRIANSVSCVTRINHEIHFSWQAQYLVSLDNERGGIPPIRVNAQRRGSDIQTDRLDVPAFEFESHIAEMDLYMVIIVETG